MHHKSHIASENRMYRNEKQCIQQ